MGIILVTELILRMYNPWIDDVAGDRILLSTNKTTIINNINPKLPSKWQIRTNNLGFRGSDLPDKPEEYFKIFVIGGTQAYSIAIDEEHHWSNILAAKLAGYSSKIWLNNAAFKFFSTTGAKIMMEDHILKTEPQMVLFYLGFDDMTLNGLTEYGFNTVSKKIKYLLFKSQLIRTMWTLRAHAKAEMNYHDMSINYQEEGILEQEGHRTQDLIKKHLPALKKYRSGLKELITICKINHIQPVFITHPQLYGQYTDPELNMDMSKLKISDMAVEGRWINSGYYDQLLSLYNNEVRSICRENDIPFIDLDSLMPKGTKYYFDQLDFSHQGQHEAANILYNHLIPLISNIYCFNSG